MRPTQSSPNSHHSHDANNANATRNGKGSGGFMKRVRSSRSGRVVLAATLAIAVLSVVAVGSNAAGGSFVQSVKKFFGVQPTQTSLLKAQPEPLNTAQPKKPLAPTAITLSWNTFGNLGTETTEPSTANDLNVSSANLTLGTGVTPAANGNRFGGNDWFDTGDTNPTTLAQSIAGNDYIQFIVTPNVGFSFTPTSLVFSWDRSSTGPNNVALRSSADGFATDLGTVTAMAASLTTGNTITISALTNVTTATTFRLYGYGATAAAGTGGFDTATNAVNVVLNGTTAAAPPTLGTYGTTGVALSANTTVTPSVAPTSTTSITVLTNSKFKGTLTAIPATGVVRVTNAHPAGSYPVSVLASGPSGTTNASFTLNVTTPASCLGQVAFTSAADVGSGSVNTVGTGDFNNDGKQDLVHSEVSSASVKVRLGIGDGTFGAAAVIGVGSGGYVMTAGDFNGDGNLDLATANSLDNTITVALGTGAGTFTAGPSVIGLTGGQRGIAPADMNGDGKLDLVTVGSDQLYVLTGNGAGGFSITPPFTLGASGGSDVAVGDITGDGKLDVVAAHMSGGAVSVSIGDGLGGFSSSAAFGASSPYRVTLGDVDNDGDLDLAIASGSISTGVQVRLNTAGSFGGGSDSAHAASGVAFADFNRDGTLDYVSTNFAPAQADVAVGAGNGNFSVVATSNVGTSPDPNHVVVGDFNNDGKQDFITGRGNGVSGGIAVRLGACSPLVAVTGALVNFGNVAVGGTSAEQTYTVSGSALTNDIIVTAPSTDFQVSKTSGSGFAPSITFTQSGGLVPNSTVFVRFTPQSGGAKAGNITNASTGATTKNVPVSGTGVLPVLNVTTDPVVTEGNAGTILATFTVTLTPASSQTVTVHYSTQNDTATTADNDYVALADTLLTFLPTETTKNITVTVNGDTNYESNEQFFFNINTPTNANISDNQGIGTITNDDLNLISGTKTVCPSGCDYDSLSNAGGLFRAMGLATFSGDVTALITGDLPNEGGIYHLNQWAEFGVGNYTLTIKPSGAPRAITGIPSALPHVIHLSGADRVIIDGSLSGGTDRSLTITSTSTAINSEVVLVESLAAGSSADNVTIKNCVLRGAAIPASPSSNVYGILSETIGGPSFGNDNLTIQNNLIVRASDGIVIRASAGDTANNLVIQGNTIGDAADDTNTVSRFGMFLQQTDNASISDNTIQNLRASDTTPHGFWATTGFKNSSILRNTITGIRYTGSNPASGTGMRIQTGTTNANVLIANNSISDMAGMGSFAPPVGTAIGLSLSGAQSGFKVYDNSINLGVGSFAGATNGTKSIALHVHTTTDVDLRGNIFANDQDNTGAVGDKSYAIYVEFVASPFTTINNNDYFASGPAGVLGFFGGSDKTTLTAWQAATGQDINSIAADPQFVSATNLHIKRTLPGVLSPVENAGVTLAGVTTDYDGDTRHASTPEIGADEVTSMQFSSATYSVAENVVGGLVTITVTRTAGSANAATINYATSDGAAIGGASCSGSTDFVNASGTLNFAAGDTSKTFDVAICNDSTYEGDEDFNVTLDSAGGGSILGSPDAAVVNITDDDALPSFTIDDVSHNEGDAGTTSYVFTVTKSGATALNAEVNFITVIGTATTADNDYVFQSGTLLFTPAGPTTQQITVLVNGDTTFEPNEAFTVNLNTPVDATISDADGTGTITNDDLNNVVFNADGNLAAGTYNNVTINGCPTNVMMTGNVIVNGAFTINDCGNLYTNNFVVSGPGSFVMNAGTWLHVTSPQGITSGVTLAGNIQVTGGRTFPATGNYDYAGSVNQVVGNGLPATVNDLLISNSGGAGNNTVTGNPGQVVTTLLQIIQGVYASASDYADVDIMAAGTLSLAADITVSGNWSNAGTFIPNGFGVTFDGATGQTITGNTSFFNLTKSVAAAQTFNFTAGSNTTVTNSLTLTGAAGQLLSLRSTSPGTSWNLTAAATSVDFVNVQDSNASSGQFVNATDSVDAGNNVHWFFGCPASLVVNSSSDIPDFDPGDGVCETATDNANCTLRAAIQEANALTSCAGTLPINFNIGGAGVHTISPVAPLPDITRAVFIDGYTQPGSSVNTLVAGDNAVIQIELNGTGAGAAADGVRIAGSNSTVRGLAVNRFSRYGIVLIGATGFGDNITVSGNFIGTDAAGTVDLGNGADGIIGENGFGSGSNFNFIGGTTPASRNIISGNGGAGVSFTFCSGNTVRGNFIGLAADGVAMLGNDGPGVVFGSFTSSSVVGGNDAADGTTDAVVNARNYISGNGQSGILTGGSAFGGITILGNYVGTDVTGTLARPNALGIDTNIADGAIIGGTTAGAGNLISGNTGFGLGVNNSGSVVIKGNRIGTKADGSTALGNGSSGISFNSGSSSAQVGGTAAGEANTIAFNSTDGVHVATGTSNVIRGNSIHDNGELGIDLETNGVTANDAGDGDTGANNLQNFPVITSATTGSTTVSGTLNSTSGVVFTIDVYSNATCDASGNGEGSTLLGSVLTSVTDGSGNVSFSVTVPALTAGQVITATATDGGGNTSEFSQCSTVAAACTPPAIVYVDDDWVGTPPGTPPDPGGPAVNFGCDSFATIQEGVNGVASGGTVIVFAGTYPEAVLVNRPMTLLGAQAGLAFATRLPFFTPGPNGPKANPAIEAVITAAATNPTSAANDTLHVMADNVTINGFTVDGNNAALVQTGAIVVGGINTDSRRAIQTEDAAGNAFAANNVQVRNNIIQNFAQRGVQLINGTASNTAPATSGSSINRNLVRNFGLDGIVLAFNAYADISDNTVVTNDYPTEAGIWVQDFLNTGTPHSITIANNNITVGQDNFGGIWVNLAYQPDLNINNNTVNAASGVTGAGDFTYGVYISSLRPGSDASLSGNIVGSSGGELSRGIALWNLGTAPTTVTGGTVGKSLKGVSLHDDDPNFGLAGSNSAATMNGVSIDGTGVTAGVGVFVDATNSTGDTVAMQVANNTAIINTTTAVSVVGTNASANVHDNLLTIHDNTTAIRLDSGSLTMTHNYLYTNATSLHFGASASGGFVDAHFNRIISPTTAYNNTAGRTLNLANNWWGCNAGPNNPGCGAVIGTADTNPWLVLGVSALPTSVAPLGSSSITADMTKNSLAADTIGLGALAPLPVAWSATNGTMLPTSGTILSGMASSTFTSNSASSGSGCATVDNQTTCAVVTVTAPSFSIDDVTHNEGNGGPGTTSYTFTITKTGAGAASVDYETVDGTATSPSDFTAISPTTISFLSADTTKQFTVLVNGDTTFEPNEAFTAHLSNAVNATISDADGTGTITNDDACAAFATVYVDDSWVGTTPGTDPDGGGLATSFGCDSFATIQEGVNAVTAGGTVNVAAGNYVENITIPKALTLTGAGAASVFVYPAVSNPNCGGGGGGSICPGGSNIMLVQASNVTISGMTLDGDNTSLAGGFNIGGANVDARNGIITNHLLATYNSLEVHHTTVKNIYLRGVYASSGGSFNFHDNTVQNVQAEAASIGMFNFGGAGAFTNNNVSLCNDAISSNHSSGTTYTGNTVTSSASGIHTDNAGDGGGTADTISGNTVTNSSMFGYGIWVYVPYKTVNVQNNTTTNVVVGFASFGMAPSITAKPAQEGEKAKSSRPAPAVFDISEPATTARLQSVHGPLAPPAPPYAAIFTGNTADGLHNPSSTGVYFTTSQIAFGSADTKVKFFGNTVIHNADGFYLEAETGFTLETAASFNRIIDNDFTAVTVASGGSFAGTLNGSMENNWWGCNLGPNNPGCGGIVGAGVDFDPWIVLGISASPSTISPGGTSTITADMTHNSVNAVPSVTDFVPQVLVTFGATNGTVFPTSGTITNGQATTTFTSNSTSSGSASATVDNQTVQTPVNVSAANTYTWTGMLSSDWQIPLNWTPTRVIPQATDILLVDGTSTPGPTITNIPTQTIAAFRLLNGPLVTLNAAALAQPHTLTINGATGSDLSVPAGSFLSLDGSDGLSIKLSGVGTTGTIGGTAAASGGFHRLFGDANATITFQNGAFGTAGPGLTTNMFGTGALGDGQTGSVIFASGSIYSHNAGDSPFGTVGNGPVVTFQTGSLARWFSNSGFQASGRTYANLQIGAGLLNAFNVSDSGTGDFQFDNLDIKSTSSANSSLTYTGSGTASITIRGNVTSTGAGDGGTLPDLTLTPGSGGTHINKNGGGTLILNATGNARAVDLEGGATVENGTTLSLSRVVLLGLANPHLNTLTVNSTAGITGGSSGYVIGGVEKISMPTNFTFPVGTVGAYSPVDLANATSGDLRVAARTPQQPVLAAATSLQRYWTLTEGDALIADLTFHYLDPTDIGTSNEANYQVVVVEGGNATNFPADVNHSVDTLNNSFTVLDVENFSDWTVAEPAAPTAVKLVDFNALQTGNEVMLSWQTGYETRNLGYNVYREQGGRRVAITPSLVAGSALLAGSNTKLSSGLNYTWYDDLREVRSQKSPVNYWLEDVDINGTRTLHGPIAVSDCASVRADCKQLSGRRSSRLLSQVGSKGSTAGVQFRGGPVVPVALKPELGGEQSKGPKSANADADDLARQQTLIEARPGVKIAVSREGWYRVTQPELVAAGLDPDADTTRLQLYANGRTVPIKLSVTSGSLTASDYLEFYGQGLQSTTDTAQTYCLTLADGVGTRIRSPFADTLAPPNGPSSFAYTIERKERMIYFSGLLNGAAENFFGQVVTAGQTVATIPVSRLDTGTTAQLAVTLQGVTSQSHTVRVSLNGNDLGSVLFANTDHATETFNVSGVDLLEGDNTIGLTATDGGDVSLVDVIRLTYAHKYLADNNHLEVLVSDGETKQFGGFDNASIRVIDVTSPAQVKELTPAANVTSLEDGTFAVDVRVPGATDLKQHKVLVFTEGTINTVDSVRPNNASSWWSETAGADYVIITTDDLKASVAPLSQLRSNQGMAVRVIDVEDLYDEFSFGEHSPQALRDFFAKATADWTTKPRYVVFAGDASYDPKNYLGLGLSDLVPTKLIDTSLSETASDDWLADFSNDGMADFAIGRLPVKTATELNALVAKIVNYENAAPDPTRGALLVSDNGFEAPSTAVQSLLPAGMTVATINRSSADDATIHNQIIAGINQGPRVVNYIGHGSNGVWTGASLLSNNDAPNLTNANRLSVFTMMTCYNGYFQDAFNDSLSEALLKAPGGAVAVWASTTLTQPAGQNAIDQEFYRMLFGVQPATLGDAARGAKLVTGDADVRRTWTLFGDPAMRLR